MEGSSLIDLIPSPGQDLSWTFACLCLRLWRYGVSMALGTVEELWGSLRVHSPGEMSKWRAGSVVSRYRAQYDARVRVEKSERVF